jgi:hypothetical protein
MSAFTLSPNIWTTLGNLFTGTAKKDRPPARCQETDECRQAERDCIRDMVWSNPDAFTNEMDILSMKYGGHGRF